MLFQAVFRARLQLIQIPSSLRYADDGQSEAFVADQALQRWKNLLVRQIARGAEEYQCVGQNRCHSFRSRIEIAASTRPEKRIRATGKTPYPTIRTDVRARRADCHFSSRGRYFFQARVFSRTDAQLLSIDPVAGSRQGGSSSVAERQLPKLNVAGSIPVSRSTH